ncbi:hypothetical protein A3C60_01645 [Candidatus Nomurabacteria bacterium RIFCSPHIGHO2_02_FULL_37_45]|uniref:Uncharacterized protein n=1 Tax=Candidatus Nomurabacteria bacterium RIFCSPHIGHO2_12_FULL_37_29 TaxID=1801759 RepID=A0A1F6WBR5_9BACT|nr:MAG: hypothetical protein A3C60_01645 [Candidatus Nomurabacteria bacterium RIFCSPHIGHO2_02_FULL_37_45]OGI79348.1 MAG: hypothetical protein A3F19_00765 [Candidatus Nomurabacteria bacterium RIFCSPHIGHO2_12_FULL_37_29]OGI84401.1 MAG: hypothetical protein A3A92_02270 [Candidatus Nomurabacteria bacterium RIFCSPLOWO2_01_FULL_37_49]
MSKNKIILLAIVILVVVLGFVFKDKLGIGQNAYSVVYMTTGEVYVGKLTTFPDLQLKDSYILQVTKDAIDPNKNNFQLTATKDALWASESMHLVKDNVVFYGSLMSDSKIAQTIAAQKK